MKILLLTHKFSPDIGGIESISEMLADCFAEANHEVRVVTWSGGEATIPFKYKVVRQPGILELIRQHKWADVVFENNICLRLSWPAILLRKKSLVGLQTWIGDTKPKWTPQYLLKIARLKLADQVVACSKCIQQGCWPKAVVIGNPYKQNVFRKLNGVPVNDNLVFVGRLVSDKGADLAIKALEIISSNKNLPMATLNIVGDGPEKEALQLQVSKAGLQHKVKFLGSLRGNDLVETLNQNKYMLVPSKWKEPFGIVGLEGMACGCIPIVADGGGLPDAVGNGGVVFKSGDANDLATSVLQLAANQNKQDELRKNATQHLAKFSASQVSKQYLSMFQKILS